ncbi:hypothetical protein EBR57_05215 [bacterium]|nr:hypothetical protein [bacterium]
MVFQAMGLNPGTTFFGLRSAPAPKVTPQPKMTIWDLSRIKDQAAQFNKTHVGYVNIPATIIKPLQDAINARTPNSPEARAAINSFRNMQNDAAADNRRRENASQANSQPKSNAGANTYAWLGHLSCGLL